MKSRSIKQAGGWAEKPQRVVAPALARWSRCFCRQHWRCKRGIHALNIACPRVNAIISLQDADGLLRQADARDAQLARGALRVSGNEDFKRMVWLEASVRGVKTVGYEPNPGDLEVLKKEREARLVNRIEPARADGSNAASAPTEKSSARGGGGRKAVLAAIEAVLVAKHVPEKQREAVMAAATEKLAQRVREGQTLKVKVYDKAAPSQRSVVTPTSEVQRIQDRAAPVR